MCVFYLRNDNLTQKQTQIRSPHILLFIYTRFLFIISPLSHLQTLSPLPLLCHSLLCTTTKPSSPPPRASVTPFWTQSSVSGGDLLRWRENPVTQLYHWTLMEITKLHLMSYLCQYFCVLVFSVIYIHVRNMCFVWVSEEERGGKKEGQIVS